MVTEVVDDFVRVCVSVCDELVIVSLVLEGVRVSEVELVFLSEEVVGVLLSLVLVLDVVLVCETDVVWVKPNVLVRLAEVVLPSDLLPNEVVPVWLVEEVGATGS